MARPVIALLIDFGVRDHYVGAMKGIILGICPEATLVDISHEVPAHDVAAAAQELADVWLFFPPHTIFLSVVDPGVQVCRARQRPLVARLRSTGPRSDRSADEPAVRARRGEPHVRRARSLWSGGGMDGVRRRSLGARSGRRSRHLAAASSSSRSDHDSCRDWSRRMPTCLPARSAPSSAARIISRLPRTARARPRRG